MRDSATNNPSSTELGRRSQQLPTEFSIGTAVIPSTERCHGSNNIPRASSHDSPERTPTAQDEISCKDDIVLVPPSARRVDAIQYVAGDGEELTCGRRQEITSRLRQRAGSAADGLHTGLARCLANHVIPSRPNGFTFDPRMLRFPTFGCNEYVVSLEGYERKYLTRPTVRQLYSWLKAHWTVLQQPDHYIGEWPNPENGLFYLDVSVAVQGRRAAEAFGTLNSQLTIYHPSTDVAIPIARPSDGTRKSMTEVGGLR